MKDYFLHIKHIQFIPLLFLFLFFLPAYSFADTSPENTEDQLITMDFHDVELRQVIRFVSEMTKKNFIVDEKLKGKVTVITPKGITAHEAYKIFESILAVHNYKIVEAGGAHKIVPEAEAKSEGFEVLESDKFLPQEDSLASRIVYLDYANANVLVALLKPFMHSWGAIASYLPRNALIITDSSATVEKLLSIIKSLDKPLSIGAWKMFPLKYGNATTIEKVLNSVYADFNSHQPKGVSSINIFSDMRINTLLVIAPKAQMTGIEQMINQLDVKADISKGNLHLYYPKNSKADIIAKVLNDLVGKVSGGTAAEQSTSFSRKISIVGEETTNTLVISATPQDYEMLLPIIEGLDLRRLQVYIEALILEITADRGAELGIEWRSPENLSSESITTFGGTNFGSLNSATYAAINDPSNNPLAAASGLAVGLVKGTVSYGGTEYLNLGALARALQSDTDINILATPNILVVDNEEAEILVGQNVPFRTGTNTGTTTATTYERKDIGLKLQVTPQILEGGKIKLTVYQEKSSLAPSITIGSNETEVVTNKRSVKTTVFLDNTHMVVLGGLVSEETQEIVNMVPCLGGIPGLGELFKNTKHSSTKTNMMVFIRPQIINTYEDLINISSKKYKNVKDRWGDKPINGSIILPRTKPISLPDMLPSVEYETTRDNNIEK